MAITASFAVAHRPPVPFSHVLPKELSLGETDERGSIRFMERGNREDRHVETFLPIRTFCSERIAAAVAVLSKKGRPVELAQSAFQRVVTGLADVDRSFIKH